MSAKYEMNMEFVKELSRLISENPDMSVIIEIDTSGMFYGDSCLFGCWDKPKIKTVVCSANNDKILKKSKYDRDNCYSYYGLETGTWSDEKIKAKAASIPWEKVIAIPVTVI